MKGIIIIGAGKFALEAASYVADSQLGPERAILGYLSAGEEEPHAAPLLGTLADHRVDPDAGYVLGISDIAERARVIAEFIDESSMFLPNVVHRSVVLTSGVRMGEGNVVGPYCYVGANVSLGRLNMFNAVCTIGHHSRIGDDNFFAPDVHLGNSVEIGNHNLFGIGVRAVHELVVGNFNRIQAGTSLVEPLESGDLVTASVSVKRVGLYRRMQHG